MKIACVILAAGRSQRFGENDKLLLEVDGVPLIRRAADCALRSNCSEIHVITRPSAANLEAALRGLPVHTRINTNHTNGIGSSIAFGIGGLSPEIDGALILPADMPWMETSLLDTLIEKFQAGGGNSIVYPTTTQGEQRNPVLWPRSEFRHLLKLDADKGARDLITRGPTPKISVKHCNNIVFRDIDRPSDLPD